MKIIKAVIILLALFTFMPIKAISINEVNGPISNEVWQSVANKLRFCYDKNLYHNDFYRILKASNAYELDKKIKQSLSDKDLTLFLVYQLADGQWNAAWFVDPEWAVREAMEKRLYFSKAEIDAIIPQYLKYRKLTEADAKSKYIKQDKDKLNHWLNNGFPTFNHTTSEEDENLSAPEIEYNLPLIRDYFISRNKFKEGCFVEMYMTINRNGEIENKRIAGDINDEYFLSSIIKSIRPATYHFEYSDTVISVPYKIYIKIRQELEYEDSGWVTAKYNSKKSIWTFKDFYKFDNSQSISLVKDFFENLPIDSPLRKGKHEVKLRIENIYFSIDTNPTGVRIVRGGSDDIHKKYYKVKTHIYVEKEVE